MDDEFASLMNEMNALLDDIEKGNPMDSFINVNEKENQMDSIIRLKPSDFDMIKDGELRRRMKGKYLVAEKDYLGNLEKLLLFQGKQIGKYLLPYRPGDDLSLNERMIRTRIELNKLGFTTEQLRDYLLKVNEDLNSFLSDDKTATESRGR